MTTKPDSTNNATSTSNDIAISQIDLALVILVVIALCALAYTLRPDQEEVPVIEEATEVVETAAESFSEEDE